MIFIIKTQYNRTSESDIQSIIHDMGNFSHIAPRIILFNIRDFIT